MATEPTFGERMRKIVQKKLETQDLEEIKQDHWDLDGRTDQSCGSISCLRDPKSYMEDVRRSGCLGILERNAKNGHVVTGFYRTDEEHQHAKNGTLPMKIFEKLGDKIHGMSSHYPKPWDIEHPTSAMFARGSDITAPSYVEYVVNAECYDYFKTYRRFISLDGLSSISKDIPICFKDDTVEKYNGALNVSINSSEPLFYGRDHTPPDCA